MLKYKTGLLFKGCEHYPLLKTSANFAHPPLPEVSIASLPNVATCPKLNPKSKVNPKLTQSLDMWQHLGREVMLTSS